MAEKRLATEIAEQFVADDESVERQVAAAHSAATTRPYCA